MTALYDTWSSRFECAAPGCGVVIEASGPADDVAASTAFAAEVEAHQASHLPSDVLDEETALVIRDASPDYRIATPAVDGPAVEPLTVRASIAARALASGVILASIAGAGAGYGVGLVDAPARIETRFLALSDGCAATVDAAEDLADAVEDLAGLDARDARADEAFGEAWGTGTAEEILAAAEEVEASHVAQREADDRRAAALRDLRDANNRCLTDVDAARGTGVEQ